MRKIILVLSLLASLDITAYPAYVASDCGWLNRKAVTYDKLGVGANPDFYAVTMELKRKYNTEPYRSHPEYYKSEFLTSYKGYIQDNPGCNYKLPDYACYERTIKAVVETNYEGFVDPQDYWRGITTHHFWRRDNPRTPGMGYNSTRILRDVTTCYLSGFGLHDWDENGIDDQQKPLYPIDRKKKK